ncbi:MAG: ABC transporter ATP-binding protein [Deltaproteobacteria bacterium]|nr:MAG: ABC transporter ATP-binding protein [Deltaproteobacteria bacterium]UCH07883.1 MAG: ABC transporter ATP-binding protein [Deltaproteobacteria bacterium]
MIELRSVTKSYGRVGALNNVSLQVTSGDFLAIVGPSGSGKTTFLNLVSGLLSPTSGETLVDGVSLGKLGPRERAALRREKFGFVFQTFNLISYLTAIENVEIPLYLAGAHPAKQRLRAGQLLEKVGLKDRLFHLPSELSLGEQQRVAIARALANNASALLADEPTGNLDSKTGKDLMAYVKELNGLGVTVLLVTHDPAIADFAKRKIRIVDGRIIQ